MANFVVLNGDKVINIIEARTMAIAEKATGMKCVEYDYSNHPEIGWLFDGENFINPNVMVLDEAVAE